MEDKKKVVDKRLVIAVMENGRQIMGMCNSCTDDGENWEPVDFNLEIPIDVIIRETVRKDEKDEKKDPKEKKRSVEFMFVQTIDPVFSERNNKIPSINVRNAIKMIYLDNLDAGVANFLLQNYSARAGVEFTVSSKPDSKIIKPDSKIIDMDGKPL